MKLQTNISEVELGDAQSAPQQFGIVASKEAFAILSSGLYNNKILAVIRELSCNAYDSHVSAGKKEVPFEIHLPTVFEPHFGVKDFGTGLSHDEVISLYTMYFGTNKSDSNEKIGAFGLGSKSPFSYTEGFTLVSRHGGKKRIYSAFIGDQGTPQIQLQTEEDTEEVNGLEVTFPTRSSDLYEFKNNAAIALEFFDPQPILNTPISVKQCRYIVKQDKWGLRADEHTHHTRSVRAIQGMVQYAVGNIDESKLQGNRKRLNDMPLDIFFDIGDLSVAASRETLSNDERTVDNVLKAFDDIIFGIIADAKKQVEACATAWDARLKLEDLTKTGSYGKIIAECVEQGMFYGNFPNFTLSKEEPVINEFDSDTTTITLFSYSYNHGGDAVKSKIFDYNREDRDKIKADLLKGDRKRSNYDHTFNAKKNTIFIIGDIAHGAEKYIHYFLQSAQDNRYASLRRESAFLIQRINKDVTVDQVSGTAKTWLKKLGDPPSILLSTLKERYKDLLQVPAQAAQINRDVLVFDEHNSYYFSRFKDGYERAGWKNAWATISGPLPTGRKFYMPVKSLQPTNGSWEFAQNFHEFMQAVRETKLFNFNQEKIYSLQDESPLRKNPDWVVFTDYVFNQLATHVTPKQERDLSLILSPFKLKVKFLFDAISKRKLISDSPLSKFADLYCKLSRKNNDIVAVNLATVITHAVRNEKYKLTNVVSFAEQWKTLLVTYPLLKAVSDLYHYDEDIVLATIEYIRLLDEERERQEVCDVVTLAIAIADSKKEEGQLVQAN